MLIRTISISRPLSVQIRKEGTLRHWRVPSSICFRFGHTLGARAYVLSVSCLVGFGYAKAPWGVCSKGLPVSVMRRRATLPHPVGCSTIAVPGLSSGSEWDRVSPAHHGRCKSSLVRSDAGVCRPVAATRTGQRTRICRCLVGQTMLVAVWCRLQEEDAVQPPVGWGVSCCLGPLVPVGSRAPRGASTSGLSTRSLAWGLQELEGSTECLS